MLTKFPEGKKSQYDNHACIDGKTQESTERLSTVGETNVGIIKDVNGTHSHS